MASEQHSATRGVPTDMIHSARVEVVRGGPGSIAECGAGATSRIDSSTGSEAGLGVLLSRLRQRGQGAEGVVTEDYLHRCTSTSTRTSRDDYSL